MFGDSSLNGLTLLLLLFCAFLVTPGAFWCYRFCRWIIALASRHPAWFRFGAPVLLTFFTGFIWVYWIDVLLLCMVVLVPFLYLGTLIFRTIYLLFRGSRELGSLDMLELLASAMLLAMPVSLLVAVLSLRWCL